MNWCSFLSLSRLYRQGAVYKLSSASSISGSFRTLSAWLLCCCCWCRTLQRQEEAREAALKAFRDSMAARAVQAGAAAVAENRSRVDREERLMAASEVKAKAEAEVSG